MENTVRIENLIDEYENSESYKHKLKIMEILVKRALNESEKEKLQILNIIKDEPAILGDFLYGMPDEFVEKNLIEIVNIVKDNNRSLANVWDRLSDDYQDKKLEEVIYEYEKEQANAGNIEEQKRIAVRVQTIWKTTSKKIQEKKSNLYGRIINLVKSDLYSLEWTIKDTCIKIQKESVKEIIDEFLFDYSNTENLENKENILSIVYTIWKNIDENVQIENEDLLLKMMEIAKEKNMIVSSIWQHSSEKLQDKNIEKIIVEYERTYEETDNESDRQKIASQLYDICSYTKNFSSLNEDFIFKVLEMQTKENSVNFEFTWKSLLSEEKRKILIEKLINKLEFQYINSKDNEDKEKFAKQICSIWTNISTELQKENEVLFLKIMNILKNYDSLVLETWSNTSIDLQKEQFQNIVNQNSNFLKIIEKNLSGEVIINNLKFYFENKYGKEISQERVNEILEVVNNLKEKNKNIFDTIDFEFILNKNNYKNFTEEQLLKITNYKEIQEFLVYHSKNYPLKQAISYLMQNDDNWIISLNRLVKNEDEYEGLLQNLSTIKQKRFSEEFIQQLLSVLSDTQNYFDINNAEDINNYNERKNNICIKILNGDTEDIPAFLENQFYINKADMYKFALLEYKFGISLIEAKRLVQRYGADVQKLPEGMISDYINLLKEIIEREDIIEIVNSSIKKKTLKNPWNGFPSSRNIESKIINLFEELYNDTLYNPREHEEDKIESEIYIEERKDENGKIIEIEHEIDVYRISHDFAMNIRVEGAYRDFEEPDDYNEYYDNPDIKNHGNCESYIRNDFIAIAKNTNGVEVGYSIIYKNGLTACAPYDLGSENSDFSIYEDENNEMPVEYRIPDEMINNTRHNHNEMVKERIIVDYKGNVLKSRPNYVVWVDEEAQEERTHRDIKKEKDWIKTKKLAAQLGIPIVIINREYFAKREMDKIQVIRDLIMGEKINEEKYGDYLKELGNLSKSQLIKKLILKFENNRVGIKFNDKLKYKYFTKQQLKELIMELIEYVKVLPEEEAKECMKTIIRVSYDEVEKLKGPIRNDEKNEKKDFFTKLAVKVNKMLIDFERNDGDERKKLFKLMKKISNAGYYDKNKQHSIEHIQKVILFSEFLAENEGVSDGEKNLLLVSAAFHDSARGGKDGNTDHAGPSAILAGEVLSKANEYGISKKSDVAIIQTAIHYHGYRENVIGKVDIRGVRNLARTYGVKDEDLQKTIKICELLKDADALDRFRFAENGTLNPLYLRSKTAKNSETISYARTINGLVATKILKNVYNISDEKIKEENPIELLRKTRLDKNKEESHLEFFEIYEKAFPEIKTNDFTRSLLQIYLSDIETAVTYGQILDLRKQIEQNLLINSNEKSSHEK